MTRAGKLTILASLVLLSAIFLFFQLSKTSDREITPSHVHQATESLLARLQQFATAANVTPERLTYWPEDRQPRHVLMATRAMQMRLNHFAQDRDISSVRTPIFAVMEVNPSNVLAQVKLLAMQVEILSPTDKPIAAAPLPPFRDGYAPSDVYRNLLRISLLMDALDVPQLQPSDVHQLARTMAGDLLSLCFSMDAYCPTELPPRKEDLKPADVYENVRLAYKQLQSFARLSRLRVKGDIVIPGVNTGASVPSHVHALVSQMQADVGAVKLAMGIDAPTVLAPWVDGKTPSDVYQQIDYARLLIAALTDAIG